jgi:predicted transcriptional regulator
VKLTAVAFRATIVAIMATSEKQMTLSSVLFADYRRRVLGLLLLHPEQRYYLRELARLTGTVPGTLKRELTKLADAGVLLRGKSKLSDF